MNTLRTMAKSVCIVGAGPAGIITAKTLLHNHPPSTFQVTVFEQSDRIGGLWPTSSMDDGMVNPDMCTNLSRHTVSFSDLAWPESAPLFPKAWQVGQYLQRYVEKYSGVDIQLSSKVLKASVAPDPALHDVKRWKVIVQRQPAPLSDRVTQGSIISPGTRHPIAQGRAAKSRNLEGELTETLYFDHLVVASGFFGKPKIPASLSSPVSFPVQHSTQFRTIQELLNDPKEAGRRKGDKILVVGGSMSGAEVAASIAMQLSSYINSPGAQGLEDADKYSVYHVMKRPFWILPLFLPVTPLIESDGTKKRQYNPVSTFLPLDLVMYDLSRRPPGGITNNSGLITPTAATLINQYLHSFLGSDQSDLSTTVAPSAQAHPLAVTGDILHEAPWVAISDTYAEFVRSGQITAITGSVTHLGEDSATILSANQQIVLEDVAAVVLATGFESSPSLDFLDDAVLQTLDHDPHSPPFPLSLHNHSTTHPSLPTLGFVGFYRGPYWGVMEMQARLLGHLWSLGASPSPPFSLSLTPDSATIQSLREVYRETPSRVAQFPMGDYVYLMESFHALLGESIVRAGEEREGLVVPARYTSPSFSATTSASAITGEQKQQSMQALSALRVDVDKSQHERRFVARAIFRGLQGTWKLRRELVSALKSYPSGTFRGEARFAPRVMDEGGGGEYLYAEEGDFETEGGVSFRATRRYAYRYSEAADILSVWFIKSSDNRSVDYLFHELEILPPIAEPESEKNSAGEGSEGKTRGWRARASHLCIDDTYDVEYEFWFRGAALREWRVGYGVRGPRKEYRIRGVYVR